MVKSNVMVYEWHRFIKKSRISKIGSPRVSKYSGSLAKRLSSGELENSGNENEKELQMDTDSKDMKPIMIIIFRLRAR